MKTIIGKDVIEALTLGMYEDSRFIYREYIQNSADQIDKAVNLGILESIIEGEIWITIDAKKRSVVIEDNATGIKSAETDNILRNIASSTKERGTDKGFRGIGRLGGLGYCDSLTFETSYKGEDVKSVMIWGAKELRNIINNRKSKEEASSVIDQITVFSTKPEEGEKHYFKVTLENVNNDALLDKNGIMKYLEMVAPVPFHPKFYFKEIINSKLKEHNLCLDEYKIYVNTNQVFKAYTTRIYEGDENNKKKKDEIFDIQTFLLKEDDDELLSWGWYGISKFDGIIPKINPARGLRLRKDNIQIGSDSTLEKLHKQKQNNAYFFGEVHGFSSDLIPNARRDYFLENKQCLVLEERLKKYFEDELKPLFNIASKIRSADNAIIRYEEKKKEIKTLVNNGVTNKEEKNKLEHELDQNRQRAEEGKKKLEYIKKIFDEKNDQTTKKLYEKIVKSNDSNVLVHASNIKEKINSIPYRTDKYSKLSKNERKLISSIFEIIDTVLTKDLAENLKKKIDEKYQ